MKNNIIYILTKLGANTAKTKMIMITCDKQKIIDFNPEDETDYYVEEYQDGDGEKEGSHCNLYSIWLKMNNLERITEEEFEGKLRDLLDKIKLELENENENTY